MNNFKNVIKNLEKDFGKIDYPINDSEAYLLYPDFNIVYNKMIIAKFQGLDCNPFPIEPKSFPIISKPIINLMGMGLKAKKVVNKKQFSVESFSGNFWCEFINGDHHSWDLIVRNGEIIYHTCFFGKKSKHFGLFKYWQQIKKELFPSIKLIVEKFLPGFTGSVNMETLDDKVIEVHLRMGDIDLVDKDIIKLALYNIMKLDDETINSQLKIINSKKIKFIYLVPVWESMDKFCLETLEKKYKIIRKDIEDILINDDKIVSYYIDDPYHPNPENFKRWFLILTYNLGHGIKVKNILEDRISKETILIK